MNIFVESPTLADVVQALEQFSNVEEICEVTGEYDIRAVVSAESIEEFRDFLKYKILKINGVRSTVTSVVFNAPKRPKQSANASDATAR